VVRGAVCGVFADLSLEIGVCAAGDSCA
jgi:hypothetical protein